MKIVVDTNVLFSGLYSRNGASYILLEWLFKRSIEKVKVLVVSVPLVSEYEDVLLRPENLERLPKLSEEDLGLFICDICNIAHLQEINFLWRPFLRDHKDDMVLEAAFNGNADFIITPNLKDFANVEKYFSIKVLTPGQFLPILKMEGTMI